LINSSKDGFHSYYGEFDAGDIWRDISAAADGIIVEGFAPVKYTRDPIHSRVIFECKDGYLVTEFEYNYADEAEVWWFEDWDVETNLKNFSRKEVLSIIDSYELHANTLRAFCN
jgi:hypothetical protein